MRRFPKMVIGAVALGLLSVACAAVYGMASKAPAGEPPAEHPNAKVPMEEKNAATQSVYVCPDCHTMAMKAGKCTCGKELVQKHMLGVKDGQAMLCDCPEGCKCDIKGVDNGKCACGKEVKTASCKGMYCCMMGCPKMSDTPGKCVCGMELKKCE